MFPNSLGFKAKMIPSTLVVSISMIMTLPLCGFLFDCGCTWLWAEMDQNCNIHDLEKIHKCPWCKSMVSAVISIGLSIIASVWVLHQYKALASNHQKFNLMTISLYTTLGLIVFFVVAFFTGWASAFFQNYPYFFV